MSLPTSSGNLILSDNYREMFNRIIEIIGRGENGYGLKNFSSLPVSTGTTISIFDWNNLYDDVVNVAWKHITNLTTSTQALPLSTSTIIEPTFHNELYNLVNYIEQNRYTCAEYQYYRDPVSGSSLNTTGGVSIRTSEWGGSGVLEIQHKVKTKWTTRLNARYFFNSGGYYTWTPFHFNNGFNDLDTEWAVFINSIQNDQINNPLIYDRNKFINHNPGTTLTLRPAVTSLSGNEPTYVQGTLRIRVEVTKFLDEKNLEFIVSFTNSDSSVLVVEPDIGYWNVQV